MIHLGGTGVVGVLANGEGRTVLAARADMDALPVTEATGLAYSSEVAGVVHACGHDVHVSTLLGAAALMADARGTWSGTYIALFQPAEEIRAGSQAMDDDDLVTKVPRPDVALAQHLMPMAAGTLATTAGPVLSAGDSRWSRRGGLTQVNGASANHGGVSKRIRKASSTGIIGETARILPFWGRAK